MCVNSTIWMHHMDADKAYRGEAGRELDKNATSYIEHIPQNSSCTATYLPYLKPFK